MEEMTSPDLYYESFYVSFTARTLHTLQKILEEVELDPESREFKELTEFELEIRARLQHIAAGDLQVHDSTVVTQYVKDNKAERRRQRRLLRKQRRAGLIP